MNKLSIFLYLAETIPNVSTFVFVISTIFLLYFVVMSPPKGVKIFSMDHNAPFIGIPDHYPQIIILSFLMTITFLVPSTI